MKKEIFITISLLCWISFCKSQQQQATKQGLRQSQTNSRSSDWLKSKLGLSQDSVVPCNPNFSSVCGWLSSGPFLNDNKPNQLNDDAIVSPNAFSKLIKETFTKTVLGNENSSKVNRYATLDLSSSPTFSFSPYVYETDTKNQAYTNIVATTISGKLNGKSLFKFKDFRDLNLGIAWIRLLNWTHFKPREASSKLKESYLCNLRPGLKKLCSSYTDKLTELCENTCLSEADKKKSLKNLGMAFLDSYGDLELQVAEEFWSRKHFYWIRSEILGGWDRINVMTQAPSNSFDPVKFEVFTPSLKLSGNYFTQKGSSSGSFLFTIWASMNRKHTLSEAFTPTDFQQFTPVNDSINRLKETNSVFLTNSSLKTGIVGDFGIRTVRMFDIGRNKLLGASFSFSRKGIVYNGKFPSLFTTEAGIVIPFLQRDGLSALNLEIFYQNNVYSNFPNANDRFLGARFNVPISN